MSKVLIVYCSMTGNTEVAAKEVAAGAKAAGAEVVVKTGFEAKPDDLLACDAVALGSYDAFSYMGGGLKDFLDRALYPTQGKITGKPYGAFLTHGGGGKAIASMENIAGNSLKLTKVSDSVLVVNKPEGKAIDSLRLLGEKLAKAGK